MPDLPQAAPPEAAANAAAPSRGGRRSACPGLLRVVPARDGGLCRIKLALGQLTAAQAHAVAGAAERQGNGIVELTNRANIQLRGVAPAAETALVEALVASGLGPTAAGGDDVRNVMVGPAHGIDPAERYEVAPLAERLLARLQQDARYHALSPKFAIQLDGGGVGDLDHAQDLWLSPGDAHLALGVASSIGAPRILALVPQALAFDAAVAAVDLFLRRAPAEAMRYRDLLDAQPIDALQAELRAALPAIVTEAASLDAWRRVAPALARPIGLHAQRQAGRVFVGAASALGRVSPATLRALADLAASRGDGTIRLTPWQGIVLPNVAERDSPDALARLAALGFATRRDDPLASLVACAGGTGCDRGKADTKADALRLAGALAAAGIAPDLHLSGCIRSCASARVAAFTLEAVATGRYDLYVRDDKSSHRFGRRIAAHVTPESAIARLIP